MRIKKGFVLRTVANEHVVMAIGQACRLLNGLIKLNESGAFLWKMLADGAEKEELVLALQQEYGIDGAQAEWDVEAFLDTLKRAKCIE